MINFQEKSKLAHCFNVYVDVHSHSNTAALRFYFDTFKEVQNEGNRFESRKRNFSDKIYKAIVSD